MAEPLKATFFTLKHRDRAILAPATLVLALIVALIVGAFVALNWSTLSQFPSLFAMSAAETKDPARALSLVSGVLALMGTAFLLMIPLYLAIAAYEAGCLRWMIRGEAPGLFGLQLDHDAWRIYGVYWCWLIVHLAVGMVVGMLMAPIVFATMPIFTATGQPPDFPTMMHWQLSVQLPVMLAQYAPLIFLGVRFGPAAATSIARGRFSFFEAWTVTRGRFFELLGSFALLWLLAGIAMAAIFAALMGGVIAHAWPLLQSVWQNPSQENMQAYFASLFSPQALTLAGIAYGANFVVVFALALLSYGVNARAAEAALAEGKIMAAQTS